MAFHGSGIRTFNSAKKFAEEIMHPLLKSHSEAKIRTRLGAVSDEEAIRMSKNLRTIKRFNAMKERITIQQTLLSEIEGTVRLNNRITEIKMLETIEKNLAVLEEFYDSKQELLLVTDYVNGEEKPVLTDKFREMGAYLDRLYVQLQKIMTRNKLLFYGEENEFLENEELLERIKNENRRA